MQTLKTGDILLFSEKPTICWMSTLDCIIKCCTCSKYSHAALVIVDPPWAPQLKGIYIWESSWHGIKDPQDGIVKFGVQLTPLEFYTQQYPGTVSIYVRKGNQQYFKTESLLRVQTSVYKHKYDDRPYDWCAACLRRKIPRQTDVFTCSAFVSFILTNMGVLSLETDWTIVRAADLSSDSTGLCWRTAYSSDIYLGTFSPERPKKNSEHYQKMDF